MIKFYSNFEQNEEIGYKYDKEEIELAAGAEQHRGREVTFT